MKKIPNWHRNTGCPVQILFMAGFLIGMILPDIAWKMEWHQKTISAMYLLRSFAAGSEAGVEYFLQVLGMRGSVYLLGAACGISVFGVPFAVAGSMYLGIKIGLLLTMSVLQFGFQGGMVGVGLLFPQYLVYIPCIFYLFRAISTHTIIIYYNPFYVNSTTYKQHRKAARIFSDFNTKIPEKTSFKAYTGLPPCKRQSPITA